MVSTPTQRIAAAVRVELARQGISQADLARHVFGRYDNTTRNLISRRITGRVPFRADELAAVADYIGCRLDTLTGPDAA